MAMICKNIKPAADPKLGGENTDSLLGVEDQERA